MDREQVEHIVRECYPSPGRFIDTGNEEGFWLIDDGYLRSSYLDDERVSGRTPLGSEQGNTSGGNQLCSAGVRRIQHLGLKQLTQAFEREASLSEQVNLREDFLRTFQRLGVFRLGSPRSLPTFFRSPLQTKILRRSKSGITLFKNNPSWFIALNIQAGVRRSLQVLHEQERQQRNTTLQSADFMAAFVCQVEAGDRVREIPHENIEPLSDTIKWEFSAPRVFARLRQLFGYTDEEFLASMCNPAGLVEIPSPGNSRALFFLTHDQKFLLKTITRNERLKLIGMLPAYHEHVAMDPLGTLLPQYLALFQIRTRQRHHIRFVVVPDLFPSAFRLHEKYDLKGSRRSKPRVTSWRSLPRKRNERLGKQGQAKHETAARKADDSGQNGADGRSLRLQVSDLTFTEQEWCDRIAFSQLVAVPILKEDDIRSPFLIPANEYTTLMRMLERDTALLEDLLVMDYSLLIGLSEPIPAGSWNQVRGSLGRSPSLLAEPFVMDEAQRQSLATGPERSRLPLDKTHGVPGIPEANTLTSTTMPGHRMDFGSPTGASRITETFENAKLFRDLIAFRREAGAYLGYKLRLGIIDALQQYRVSKRLEFGWKLFIYCGAVPSVCPPTFYRHRFLEYMRNVFVPYNELELPLTTSAPLERVNGIGEPQQ
jgi:hypothetical protein